MGKSPQTAPRNRRGIRWLIQTIIPKISPQPYPSLTKLISQPSLVFQHDCPKCYRENHAKLFQTLNAFPKFIPQKQNEQDKTKRTYENYEKLCKLTKLLVNIR